MKDYQKIFCGEEQQLANQFECGYKEGGKGLSTADVMTGDTHTTPRRITPQLEDDIYYASHEAIDFYHHYKEDIS